mmetsp:Transcript_16959/g.48713  ORF Transcript_16959/g.48713 Transcript_16959/m.48713 type:complete len:982 (+) Transcript_16959:697-3642(+)
MATLLMLLFLAVLTTSSALLLGRPPAPTLASRASDQLVLYVKSFDFAHLLELQRSDDGESWQKTAALAHSTRGTAATVTADGLLAKTEYRFRVRRTTSHGDYSLWSEPSEPFTTLSTVPGIPTNLRATSTSSNSLGLTWKPPLDSKEAPILSYDIQYRISSDDDRNTNTWIDTRPVSSIENPRKKEIQLVSTAIHGNDNASGTFWLEAQFGPRNRDVPSAPISGPISWNSSAADFQRALENIEGIGAARVYVIEEAASKPNFEWKIEFEVTVSPFPLLQVHNSTLEGHVSLFPEIRRLQSATEETHKSDLALTIDNLEAYEYYDARVRATNSIGGSNWTKPVQLQTKPPPYSTDGLFFEPSDALESRVPLKLSIVDVQHDSVTLTWPRSSVEPTEVELSVGREGSGYEPFTTCSEEFVTVKYIYSKDVEVSIEGLAPNTPYCARMMVGPSGRSQEVAFVTTTVPVNSWIQVHARGAAPVSPSSFLHSAYPEGHRCETPRVPTGRRGHSLVVVDDVTFLFGGYGRACVCDDAAEGNCTTGNYFLNDLWRFDEVAQIFTLLREASFNEEGEGHDWPSGRELFSATAMDGRGSIIIVGGRGANGQVFGGVWEISVSRTVSQIIASEEEKILVDGAYTSAILNFDAGEERCIKSIEAEISLHHPCIEQIGQIDLHGPEGHRTNLFSSGSVFDNNWSKCEAKSVTITFADNAIDKLSEGEFPEEGTFQPMGALDDHFLGSTANGQWTIAILDTLTDTSTGVLNGWTLRLSTKPSNHQVSAQKVVAECQGDTLGLLDCFAPRHSHTAIGIGDEIYITGGKSTRVHSDGWKLNVDAEQWTRLDIELPPWRTENIESFVLTPGGVVSMGADDSFFYDLIGNSWAPLDIGKDSPGKPSGRNVAAYTYLEESGAILMHGGSVDIKSSFCFSDTWTVSMDHLLRVKSKDVEQTRAHKCQLILRNTDGSRSWEDIVKRAWCLEQYQSFRMAYM